MQEATNKHFIVSRYDREDKIIFQNVTIWGQAQGQVLEILESQWNESSI